jgi:hypothetical protein
VSDAAALPHKNRKPTRKHHNSIFGAQAIKVESTPVSGGEDVSGATTAEA